MDNLSQLYVKRLIRAKNPTPLYDQLPSRLGEPEVNEYRSAAQVFFLDEQEAEKHTEQVYFLNILDSASELKNIDEAISVTYDTLITYSTIIANLELGQLLNLEMHLRNFVDKHDSPFDDRISSIRTYINLVRQTQGNRFTEIINYLDQEQFEEFIRWLTLSPVENFNLVKKIESDAYLDIKENQILIDTISFFDGLSDLETEEQFLDYLENNRMEFANLLGHHWSLDEYLCVFYFATQASTIKPLMELCENCISIGDYESPIVILFESIYMNLFTNAPKMALSILDLPEFKGLPYLYDRVDYIFSDSNSNPPTDYV